MPPMKPKSTKRGFKHQGNPKARNFLENFLDSPAKRTRSASGKIPGAMAAVTQADRNSSQHDQGITPTINEESQVSTAKEGFVAGMVEQINNSPNSTPVKGAINKLVSTTNQDMQAQLSMKENLNMMNKNATSTLNNQVIEENFTPMHHTTIKEKVDKMELADIFSSLNSTMQGIQTELRRLNTGQQSNAGKVGTLEFVQKDEVQTMRKVLARLDQQEHTIEMLLNHVEKQDVHIQELTAKQNKAQARSMKKNIVVSGIPEKPKENCMRLSTAFFEHDLQLARTVEIKTAHRIGGGTNRPLVIKLAHANDKQFIFQNTQKLKGTNLFVTEQLPEELAERKRQQQRLKGQNKTLPTTDQLQIDIKRDRIFINNECFRSPVETPHALSWLAKPDEEKKRIKRTKVVKGDTNTTTSSTFISYAAEIKTIEDVQRSYFKVFTLEPRATHIVCAYMLPGRNFPKNQNGEDDREFGAARQMLRRMQNGNYFHRAVFVARYYGGEHIGPERFCIYRELSQAALDKLPPPIDTRLDLNTLLGNTPVTTTTTTTTTSFTFQPPAPVPVTAPPPQMTRPPFHVNLPSTTWTHELPTPTVVTDHASSWAETMESRYSELQGETETDVDEEDEEIEFSATSNINAITTQ